MNRRFPFVPATLLILTAAGAARADEVSEKAAAKLLHDKLATERPEELAILKSVAGKNVVVVQGSMDHIEQVLDASHVRYTLITPEQVAGFDLKGDQIVMVNCPGVIPDGGVAKIEKFVRAGGLLYTTDWSLLNLVQKAFPRTIAHNGRSTGNEVTAVKVDHHHDDLMSNMLLRKDRDPQWWLEGGSYPIKILDTKRVETLASSPEMKAKYGAAPVVVRFRWDDGEVIHVVSHFYRQLDAKGPAIAAKNAIDDVSGLTAEQKASFKASDAGNASMSNVESSYAFQRMTSNLIVGKTRRNDELNKTYGWTPKSKVTIEGQQVPAGERLRILKKQGNRIAVRDQRGNEGWVDAEALQAY
ncbi:MAG: hypothetical protein IT384_00175 [Deltaproteobacteria bacterium]|nr:hypothetical protein [Deltaproteobacteria bacterium]